MKIIRNIYFVAIALSFTTFSALAQSPSREFSDLIGEKAQYIDQDFGKRGYMHMKTEKSGYDSYSYWWNYNTKKCVIARTSDGRIASVVDTPAFDCNQPDPNSGNSYNYNHNAHHHDTGYHYNDNAEDAAFEKGYKDGLYNKSYHNYYSSNIEKDAYSQGYNKGVKERNGRTNYHSGHGGYQAYVGVDHLVGESTDSAFRKLESEGFVRQNERTQNGRKRINWYNNRTGQCIKTVLDKGKIYKVEKSDNCD
ncbi:hypothetical protein [Namhaeicola litoreus]|uniref:Uncharacterized protein n=1 Tax=Namhaeicola litoreus TaxID=1052145 RepID=A0ABW3Y0H1_9FLAO